MGAGILAASGAIFSEPKVGLLFGLAFLLAGLPRQANPPLLVPVVLLSAVGLSIVYQVNPSLSLQQAKWLVLAAFLYAVVAHPRVASAWEARALPVTITISALMVLTSIIGTTFAGSRAWIGGETLGFQPVEFAKIQLVVLWGIAISGGFLKWRSKPASDPKNLHPWARALSALLIACALWQRDLGPLLVLGLTAMVWSASDGVRWRSLAVQLAGLFALLVTGMLWFNHIQVRLISWLRPWDDPFGFGYQPIQSLFALARGGIFGNGWGNLSAVSLPAAITDLPLIVFAEAVGVGGVLLILFAYALLIRHSLLLSKYTHNPKRRQIGLGLTALLASQVLLILAGSVRIIPLAGITLPIVSYGGSSLVATFLLLGYLSSLREDKPGGNIIRRGHLGLTFRTTVIGLGAILIAAAYWGVFQGPKLKAHPLHTQMRWPEGKLERAGINTRGGESLSSTYGNNNTAGSGFQYLAHVVGYRDRRYGLSGLEAAFDTTLSGHRELDSQFGERLHFERPQQVYTTIDGRVQAAIEAAWRPGDVGAVVAYDPWTGEILGLLSSPAFTSDRLDESMQAPAIEAPMFNRALQGRYPPGSTWKLVTLAAALEAGVVSQQALIEDAPATIIDGMVIRNAGGRTAGILSLSQALAVSSNVIFARLAIQTGADSLRFMAQAMGFGADFHLPLPTAQGSTGNLDLLTALAAAGIGQGEVLVTPLEMAVMTAAIANGGYYVPPRIILEAGQAIPPRSSAPNRIMGQDTAALLRQGMRSATEHGTAAGSTDSTLLAGKTGTAENPHGTPHAWFVGFAPAAQPALVLVVLVENGGSGAAVAAPIAAAIVHSVFGTSKSLPVQ